MFYVEKTKLSGVLKNFIRKYIFRKQSHSQLSIFPNPARDGVTIKGNHIAEVSVVNDLGNLIATVSLKDATNPILPVNWLAAGVYYLHIKTTAGDENILKFIKL